MLTHADVCVYIADIQRRVLYVANYANPRKLRTHPHTHTPKTAAFASFRDEQPATNATAFDAGGGGGGGGGGGRGKLPEVRDAVQVAMMVNTGQRQRMAELNMIAARHRKREMVARVTAVEQQLKHVEQVLLQEALSY